MGFQQKNIKATLHHISILIMETVVISPTPFDKRMPWNSSNEILMTDIIKVQIDILTGNKQNRRKVIEVLDLEIFLKTSERQ